ncbi:MAG: ion transporter [Rhodospirillaceae bacterium]|nr:ion transporter [Rhodospirillaceae bacterium]
MTTRAILHRHLAVEAWHRHGLSPTNRVICLLILFGGTFAILSTEPHLVEISPQTFGVVELVLATLFSVEYIARVYAAGEEPAHRGLLGRLRYMVTPLALIDLIAIAPLFFIPLSPDSALLRLVRLIGILRFAKFWRYSHALRHLTEAVRMRAFELGLSFAVACFFLVLTATLLYLLEGAVQPAAFGSIPRAMWWSIMTLTTVGYGDVYPVTVLGRICAGATAVIGIGLIAMLTGILAAAFSEVFQKHREQVAAAHAAAHAAALARKAAMHEHESEAPKATTHEPGP